MIRTPLVDRNAFSAATAPAIVHVPAIVAWIPVPGRAAPTANAASPITFLSALASRVSTEILTHHVNLSLSSVSTNSFLLSSLYNNLN